MFSSHSPKAPDDGRSPVPDQPVDVPAGPAASRVDAGAGRAQAEHEAYQDAPGYDRHAMGVDQPLLFEFDVHNQVRQQHGRSRIEQVRQEILAEQLLADKAGRLEQALSAERCGADAVQVTQAVVDAERAVLTGEGPFADPTRLHEARWCSIRTTFLLPAIVGAAELGLNYLVFQSFDDTALETWALAATVGAFGVLVAFMAGAHARRHRGARGRRAVVARWLLPATAAVLLAGVGLMLAMLRGGFIDAPQINPTTGAEEPPLLSGLGVPLWIVTVGWFALQAGLSVFVAWHAESSHNPHVAAHRTAVRKLHRLRKRQDELAQTATRMRGIVESAELDKQRVQQMYEAERGIMSSLGDQMVAIYVRAMARRKAEPAFTAVAEQRLDRRLGTSDGTPVDAPAPASLDNPDADTRRRVA